MTLLTTTSTPQHLSQPPSPGGLAASRASTHLSRAVVMFAAPLPLSEGRAKSRRTPAAHHSPRSTSALPPQLRQGPPRLCPPTQPWCHRTSGFGGRGRTLGTHRRRGRPQVALCVDLGSSPLPRSLLPLCPLQRLYAGLEVFCLSVLTFLLYGPKLGVYELVCHRRAAGFQVPGENLCGEVGELRLDRRELPIGLRLAGLGRCSTALLGVVGVMPPTVDLLWVNGSRTPGAVPLISGANCHQRLPSPR